VNPQYVNGLKACDPKAMRQFFQYKNHPLALRAPKSVLDRRALNVTPDVNANNIAPDCTAVQICNSIKVFSALYAGFGYSVPTPETLRIYSTTVGCPNTLADICKTDGALFSDIVSLVRRTGVKIADQLEGVPDVAVLDNSISQLALATELYGAGSIGIRLYDRDEQDIASGKMLDFDGRDSGTLQGRHMTMTFDYLGLADTAQWRINLWGVWYPVTTRWLQARIDETWALMWRNLVSAPNVLQYDFLKVESQFVWQ